MTPGGVATQEARRLQELLEKAKQFARGHHRGPEAIQVNTEILEIDPKQVGSYTRRGTCYLAAGDLGAARADFKKALALDPKNRIALNRLEELKDARATGRGNGRTRGSVLSRPLWQKDVQAWEDWLRKNAQPTWVYHFTPIENLPGILESGGLTCNNRCQTQQVSIAHQHIQDRRSRKRVPCGPGGNLHDYVPFYFCNCSPMMYAINGGAVASYDRGQGELVYLVLKLQNVAKDDLDFVFTDRHAAKDCAAFYTDPADLREIDWELMSERWWNNTPEYPDRKERRQAEFLVHRFVPWALVEFLAVMTPQMKARVGTIVAQYKHSTHIPVYVKRAWYY